MRLDITSLFEQLPTYSTCKRLLVRMAAHVSLEVSCLRNENATYDTFVCLDPSVSVHMGSPWSFLSEPPVTACEIALELLDDWRFGPGFLLHCQTRDCVVVVGVTEPWDLLLILRVLQFQSLRDHSQEVVEFILRLPLK